MRWGISSFGRVSMDTEQCAVLILLELNSSLLDGMFDRILDRTFDGMLATQLRSLVVDDG